VQQPVAQLSKELWTTGVAPHSGDDLDELSSAPFEMGSDLGFYCLYAYGKCLNNGWGRVAAFPEEQMQHGKADVSVDCVNRLFGKTKGASAGSPRPVRDSFSTMRARN
jgi:hypothetical protein